MDNHHTHHHDHHHAGAEADGAALAELLDLDAEVLHAYLSDVIGWVAELAAGHPRRRILDLGSGTGSGALALLRRFEGAEVTAVDVSAPMLDRLRDKAREQGVAGRVRTVQADLDAGWPDTGPADLVWASNSLHHMADPDRVLAQVFAALQPGGLLAVAEMDSFPRFLPDDLGIGRPGLEARCHAARDEVRAGEFPHLGSDWGPLLAKAGFTADAERTFVIDLAPPLPAPAGRYAQASLRRLRSADDGQLSADDLATLGILLDGDGPASILRREDLTVRTTRTVWVASRP
ncbi:MAG: Methyltransferase type 12 [Actinomycetia bacterium]|nr:Methyltransferase type 12 [Actinomycetes bacterium]